MDLTVPLRAALLDAALSDDLADYANSKAIFTRRPAPPGAAYPMIMVAANLVMEERDGLNDQRSVITNDVTVYGRNDTPTNSRAVEAIAFQVQQLFHRQRGAITPPSGWTVTGIRARGPTPAPTDDEETTARRVEVEVTLAKQ